MNICCLNIVNSTANDAITPCISIFDEVVSDSERQCENRFKEDIVYAKKKRVYLWKNFPQCDTDQNQIIEGEIEDNCARNAKLKEKLNIDKLNKLLAERFPQCDGIDRQGIINTETKDGIISGFAEKSCIRKEELRKLDEENSKLDEENSKLDEENSKLDEDIRELKEKLTKQIGKL
jgi:hypothetical protein